MKNNFTHLDSFLPISYIFIEFPKRMRVTFKYGSVINTHIFMYLKNKKGSRGDKVVMRSRFPWRPSLPSFIIHKHLLNACYMKMPS